MPSWYPMLVKEPPTKGGHESLNLAALWKLPVVFIIEDNGWGISVPKSAATAVADDSVRAAAYGIPGFHVVDNDTLTLLDVAEQAVKRARKGDSPTLIEVETYRYCGHFQGATELYRPKGEVAALKAKDPIARFRRQIIGQGVTEEEANEAVSKAKREVDGAFAFVRSAAYPAPSKALTQVFA